MKMKKTAFALLIVLVISAFAGCGNGAGAKKITNPSGSVKDVLEQGMANTTPTVTPDEQKQDGPTPTAANEGDHGDKNNDNGQENGSGKIDIDLTVMSATMIYSEVYNMMVSPESYMGKVIKMCGTYVAPVDDSTGKTIHACLISDATACCSQGMEFELAGKAAYPEYGSEICVYGTFDLYKEGEYLYCILKNSELVSATSPE
jgi:hypothetical protein